MHFDCCNFIIILTFFYFFKSLFDHILVSEWLFGCSSPTLHGCRQTGSLVGLEILNTHLFPMLPNQFQSPSVFWSLTRYSFQPHDILPSRVLLVSLFCCCTLLSKSECSFWQGIALRGLFIIDKEGVIQHSTINNLAIGRSVDETMRTLQVCFVFLVLHI